MKERKVYLRVCFHVFKNQGFRVQAFVFLQNKNFIEDMTKCTWVISLSWEPFCFIFMHPVVTTQSCQCTVLTSGERTPCFYRTARNHNPAPQPLSPVPTGSLSKHALISTPCSPCQKCAQVTQIFHFGSFWQSPVLAWQIISRNFIC